MSWKILDEKTLSEIKQQKVFEDETARKLAPSMRPLSTSH